MVTPTGKWGVFGFLVIMVVGLLLLIAIGALIILMNSLIYKDTNLQKKCVKILVRTLIIGSLLIFIFMMMN